MRRAPTWYGLLVLSLQDGVKPLEAVLQALNCLLPLLLQTRTILVCSAMGQTAASKATAQQFAGWMGNGLSWEQVFLTQAWATCYEGTLGNRAHLMLGGKGSLNFAPVLCKHGLALAHSL